MQRFNRNRLLAFANTNGKQQKENSMKKIALAFLGCVLLVCAVFPCFAMAQQSLGTASKEAILVSEDGQVLFEKNATEKRPIASMTKIMTLLCIYDAVDSGKISLDDEVVVSTRASSMGGSQVFLDAHSTYKAENLVKSIIVCSANDSCVAMAEHVSGSVENFVQAMNDKARNLNLVATHFENCTGLPHVSQFSCAKDVATMLLQLITHPHYFTCASIWMEDFVHPGGRITGMTNTNKLVRFYEGCDGGKTGYTSEAQHCLAATAKRGDTRVVAVVVGAPDSKTRFREVSEMFNYAFANYQNKVYMSVDTPLEEVSVTGGKQSTVKVVANGTLHAFGKKGESDYTVQTEIAQSVKAPVAMGQVVGFARLVDGNGNEVDRVDIVATNSVEQKSFWDYVQEIVGSH